MGTAARPDNQVARFWAKVDRSAGPDGCWPFTGAQTERGYGRVYFRGRLWVASRLSFHLAGGILADDLACHRCDNPSCCNPAHLFRGNQAANIADCIAKGRMHAPPVRCGEANGKAKLTAASAAEMRAARSQGTPRRDLEKQFGVSKATVNKVLARLSYREAQA